MLSEIKRWGNSAAIRLPSKVLAAAGLDAGAPITIEVEGSRVIIEAVVGKSKKRLKLPFTERQLRRLGHVNQGGRLGGLFNSV